MQVALIGPSGQTIIGSAGLTIGRMQSNQLVVYDRRVSARHAVISSLKQGYYTITDIGSANGTFVIGLTLTRNVPHILHVGDTIRIGDIILTFQISDELHSIPNEITPFTENSPTWDGSATERLVRVRYRPDINYQPVESQEKQDPSVPGQTVNNSTWQSAAVPRYQKGGENTTLMRVHESAQWAASPSTRVRHRILVALLLAALLLMGVIAFSMFEYLNYLKRSTPGRTLDTFCSALQSKDYQSVYGQLSNKVQRIGSEKMLAGDLSNVKGRIYKISKETENFAAAKISFSGLSGQLVSGTMILVKGSSDTWKIDDLQII
jgi:pSer/pThr/pTyr-binding forkhead associated (FHA) protein